MRNDPNQLQNGRSAVSGPQALTFAARVLEASVVVFTRERFGERFFGGQAFSVVPAALLFVTLGWKDRDPGAMLFYCALWFVGWLMAAASIARRRKTGDLEHSYYNGYPTLLRGRLFRGRISESTVKAVVEPVLIFLIGVFLMQFDEPVGSFVILGALGTMSTAKIAEAQERQRLLDMRDAQLQQRHLAERFRENRWN